MVTPCGAPPSRELAAAIRARDDRWGRRLAPRARIEDPTILPPLCLRAPFSAEPDHDHRRPRCRCFITRCRPGECSPPPAQIHLDAPSAEFCRSWQTMHRLNACSQRPGAPAMAGAGGCSDCSSLRHPAEQIVPVLTAGVVLPPPPAGRQLPNQHRVRLPAQRRLARFPGCRRRLSELPWASRSRLQNRSRIRRALRDWAASISTNCFPSSWDD